MSSIVYAFVGGLLLGVATVGYLYINGRIAGIIGLLAQFISPSRDIFKSSAFWFIAGLVITPFIYGYFYQPEIEIKANSFVFILAGLLVGFGTRLGSGCTSGHGICGMSRLSKRSIIATAVFMFAGMLTVYIIRHVLG
ncbi:YeeE/YedE family protein [Acinetobacter baumannii]|uniref:YeeE/YedE family protein n=1 Tax=Acinetobacter baumannii TaxID=470 RepID=UPI000BBB83F8|nr:YeeE/YedE thiosulfate transporter family protein [Acinetobacter baumannii]MDC4301429.1 YeeE/YedE thiosulfate transporter family protein [Acinetobacter baumannii]MDC4762590.1 YeeE/YedE thiosulfate transporter family protein [Acinetobacter baumannii]MDC4860019.1 YeeE/YedE thiosulfate transporter family protein [Acinetobacter baumannii]MDC5509763.1 YeeE/YedE thiosulfate transporter family protein [Acinetobacter baumannii]PCE47022.1 transporter component [Acinetobacter baumannii]